MTDRSLTLKHGRNGYSEEVGISSMVERRVGRLVGLASHARNLSWDFCIEHFADLGSCAK